MLGLRWIVAAITLGAVKGQKDGLDWQPLKVMLHLDVGSLSHIRPLLEIGTVLRRRNHEVTFVAAEACERYNRPYNFSFISLGKSFYDPKATRQHMKKVFGKREIVNPLLSVPDFFETGRDHLRLLFPACRDVALMKRIPLITGFQTVDGFGILGTPFVTSTLSYGSITTDNLSFIQRFKDKVIDPIVAGYHFRPAVAKLNTMRAKYGVPPATTLFGDFFTSLGLANTFVGFEAAAPLPPTLKLVGPIKSDSYPPLTPELQSFLDAHPRTLYIAFGSQVVLAYFDISNLMYGSLKALDEGSIDGIVWGLGQTLLEDFPETVNINGTQFTPNQLFENHHQHVRLLSWAPQIAILEHEHTRVFVSHGGLESTFEAILSGTPILCMAYFGDQPRNARKLEDAGIGKYVNRLTVTPPSLANDIRGMTDPTGTIATNVRRMRTLALIGSRRKASGADAVEEYAYAAQACRPHHPPEYGQIPCELEHLTMASRHMSFIKANLVDVYLAAGLLALIPALMLMATLQWGFKLALKRLRYYNPKKKLD
ncbi:hypothetical protein L0F63_007317 [Massospora cicadina]|nr:hypothetical protein L0F63_007317 [Massospora cicadina]